MLNMNLQSAEAKRKKLEEEMKKIDTNIREIKKTDEAKMEKILGKAMIKKAKENPEYREKIIKIINGYSTKKEIDFFNKLIEEERF